MNRAAPLAALALTAALTLSACAGSSTESATSPSVSEPAPTATITETTGETTEVNGDDAITETTVTEETTSTETVTETEQPAELPFLTAADFPNANKIYQAEVAVGDEFVTAFPNGFAQYNKDNNGNVGPYQLKTIVESDYIRPSTVADNDFLTSDEIPVDPVLLGPKGQGGLSWILEDTTPVGSTLTVIWEYVEPKTQKAKQNVYLITAIEAP